jgi:hypothetical protein
VYDDLLHDPVDRGMRYRLGSKRCVVGVRVLELELER